MRRLRFVRLRISLALLLPIAAIATAQVARVSAVESVGFTVADMERSVDFYAKVLDFRKVSDTSAGDFAATKGLRQASARTVRMKLGDEQIELTQYLNAPGKPFPSDTRGNDRWFQHLAIITRDMDKAYARLRANRVRHASNAPQTLPDWNRNAAGIKAFYLYDPDGRFLEVLQFPADKGLAKWHRSGDELFLGIDHTAIVVADTDASLKFYRDELGMKVTGESDNYGVEQEHLNGVFGAHLRITALRAENGPGIELLEYLSPLDGRPYPLDARANDLVHWETRLTTAERSGTPSLRTNRAKSFAANNNGEAEHPEKDPDGHVLIFHSGAASSQTTQGGNQ
jgi:catechol 2,3-dioxygenase-like lactoylglutathione lyase family enzyme